MSVKKPQRPRSLSKYSETCLQALAKHHLGDKISLGGALGLLYYLDYRPTHDVDAWWSAEATLEDRQRVMAVIETALQPFGEVTKRSWGDVASIELHAEGQTVFSFQIASRSAQLEPSVSLPGIAVLLDSFPDLVASKMTALVERGAPRDFRDIYAICQAGLISLLDCWALWQRRQQLSGSDIDRLRARLAIETHLARIAQHRPLEQIEELQQREQAQQLRDWYAQEFLKVQEQ